MTPIVAAGIRAAALRDMQDQVTAVNVANGWFDSGRTVGDGLMLLVTEVAEALEEYRGHEFQRGQKTADGVYEWGIEEYTPGAKPLGFGSEMADVLIRLLDECERTGVDLYAEFAAKIEYNATRGYRHGGKIL